MSLKKPRHYSKETKLRIIKETYSSTVVAVARRHNINPVVLSRWRNELEDLGDNAFPGRGNTTDTPVARILEMERRIERLNQENSFLKKALDIFEKLDQNGGTGELP